MLLWNSILFLTYTQACNIFEILRFILSAVFYYMWLALYVMVRFLARQNVLRPIAPIIPRHEILSFLTWVSLMWFVTLLFALNEERRIWVNANPHITANYVRGMPYRRLYPWWSLYLADTDLIVSGLGRLSELLHDTVFPSAY